MSYEVKITSDNGASFTVAGYGVVFGGQDVTGDYFTKNTDFWFDRVTQTPMVLYQHGQDGKISRDVVGRVSSKRVDEIGLWVEAQIDASKQYASAIRKLVEKGILGWSSGSVPHLVQRTKGATRGTTKITSWPIVELSLTPTPAEPRTIGVRELKGLALADPSLKAIAEDAIESNEGSLEDQIEDVREAICDLLGACSVVATFPDYVIVSVYGMDAPVYWRVPYTLDADGDPVLGKPEPQQMSFSPLGSGKAELTTNARNNLGAGDFAYVDSNGGKHLPVNDEAHVRAAMSRFNQTHFESPDKKKAAARKIQARARSFGIDIASDSAVAQAAKTGGSVFDELPDVAFAYIEPGGVLDEERKTVPRATRHFPHHDEDGAIDLDAVKSFLSQPDQEHGNGHVTAHMMWHARQAGLLDPFGIKAVSDASMHDPAFTHGAAGAYLGFALKALRMADSAARDRQAMDRAGMDSHDGNRMYPRAQAEHKSAQDALAQLGKQAEDINRGEDGAALVAQYRTAFELLDLEEVA